VFENLTVDENLVAGAHSRSNMADVRRHGTVYGSFPVLKDAVTNPPAICRAASSKCW